MHNSQIKKLLSNQRLIIKKLSLKQRHHQEHPVYLQFIPFAALGIWDTVEDHPVRIVEGIPTICQEGEETYWSVFLHQVSGGLQNIADLPTKELAKTFASVIRVAAVTFRV